MSGTGGWSGLLAVAAAAAIPACGGGGAAGGIALSDFRAREIGAYCEWAARCGVYPEQATCAASVHLDLGQQMADVSAGKTAYDPSAASTCIASFSTESCSFAERMTFESTCAAVFKGALALAKPCFFGHQCASGYCQLPDGCLGSPSCCTGICSAPTIGSFCTSLNVSDIRGDCPWGSFCKLDASSAPTVCTPFVEIGQPCDDRDQCVDEGRCVSGICTRLAREGESCDAVPCDSHKLACDESTRTCVPAAPVGGACPSGIGCVGYANCDLATLTCVAQRARGETCATSYDCLQGLQCAGSCQQAADMVCP